MLRNKRNQHRDERENSIRSLQVYKKNFLQQEVQTEKIQIGNAYKQSIWYALSIGGGLEKFVLNNFLARNSDVQERVNLGFFNFIKSLAYLGVIFGQSIILNYYYTQTLDRYFSQTPSWVAPIVLSLPRLIDTFFIMFGILASYNLVKPMLAQDDKTRIPLGKLWHLFVIKSFIRVIPLYALVFGFVYSVEPYLGAGPWWDYGTSATSTKLSYCRSQPWYYHFLLGSLMDGMPSMCLPQSWFISCYIIWSLFCPPLVWLIVNLPGGKSRISLIGFFSLMPMVRFCNNMIRQRAPKLEAFTWYGAHLISLVPRY